MDAGADLQAVDTYRHTALHRMASNNLADGEEVLVQAGVMEIAKSSQAIGFLMLALQKLEGIRYILECIQSLLNTWLYDSVRRSRRQLKPSCRPG